MTMTKLVETEEVDGEGLRALMGERILIMCSNYFYAGKLIGVNDTSVLLTDAGIVYETGPFNDTVWKDIQMFQAEHYVQIAAIESFGVVKVVV